MLFVQQIKILVDHQHQPHKYFIVYAEDGYSYYYFHLDGQEQVIQKDQVPVDCKEMIVGAEDIHRLFEHQASDLLWRKLLSLRRTWELEKWSNLIGESLQYDPEEKNEWFTPKKDWYFFCIKGFYQPLIQGVEFSFNSHLLSKISYSKKNVIIFLLEEFGTLYTDGTLFKNEVMRHTKSEHFYEQKDWTVRVDYENYFKLKNLGHYPYLTFQGEEIIQGKFQQKIKSADYQPVSFVDLSLRREMKLLFESIKKKKRSLPISGSILESKNYLSGI